MKSELVPIGVVKTEVEKVPRHWTISDAEGTLIIEEQYTKGIKDIHAGQRIVVLFHFHQNPQFKEDILVQVPPQGPGQRGVFSICSPVRPNPLGMSVVEVLGIEGSIIHIEGLDVIDETPGLDIKPYRERD